MTKKEFIDKARLIHKDRYDYSKVDYKNNKTKVCIICREHGEFWQLPSNHLKGYNCQICSHEVTAKQTRLTTEEFINKARLVHGNRYDYSKVEYLNCKTKVCIICPIHGEFWMKPSEHLKKCNCQKCSEVFGIFQEKSTTEEFINKARLVHGNRYDYSKVEYINNRTRVCIICKEHGEFWQTPNSHLCNRGCSNCKSSRLENEMNLFLTNNKIEFESQKKFDWLGRQSLDFYLPKYNIGIECQGEQHFGIGGWCKEKKFDQIKYLDNRKLKLCYENKVKLLYYSNLKIQYPYFVYQNKEELLEDIKKES